MRQLLTKIRSFPQFSRPPNALLWMPMHGDEQQSTVTDKSGNGITGTITGAVWKQSPTGVWFLDYDGVDDKIDCGTPSSLGGFSLLTIGAWVRPDVYDQATLRIFCRESAGSRNTILFETVDVSFNARLYINNADSVTSSGGTFIVDKWNCVVATWLGGATSNMAIYVNGAQNNTATGNQTQITAGSLASWIGNSPNVSPANDFSFNGGIGAFFIANAVYSLQQVQDWFNKTRRYYGV